MKVRDITCSRCAGKGWIDSYTPHVRDPNSVACPQCNGKRTIRVCVPEDEHGGSNKEGDDCNGS